MFGINCTAGGNRTADGLSNPGSTLDNAIDEMNSVVIVFYQPTASRFVLILGTAGGVVSVFMDVRRLTSVSA